jgi:hypothetical protein
MGQRPPTEAAYSFIASRVIAHWLERAFLTDALEGEVHHRLNLLRLEGLVL